LKESDCQLASYVLLIRGLSSFILNSGKDVDVSEWMDLSILSFSTNLQEIVQSTSESFRGDPKVFSDCLQCIAISERLQNSLQKIRQENLRKTISTRIKTVDLNRLNADPDYLKDMIYKMANSLDTDSFTDALELAVIEGLDQTQVFV
jgi:hypothetical protein